MGQPTKHTLGKKIFKIYLSNANGAQEARQLVKDYRGRESRKEFIMDDFRYLELSHKDNYVEYNCNFNNNSLSNLVIAYRINRSSVNM